MNNVGKNNIFQYSNKLHSLSTQQLLLLFEYSAVVVIEMNGRREVVVLN
jgi:hypothetical protein